MGSKKEAIITSVKRDMVKLGLNVQLASEILTKMGFVSTGSLSLHQAIGRPGYPRGMITEIVGGFSSGKSVLTLIAAAIVTRRKRYAIIIDNEKNYKTTEAHMYFDLFGIDKEFIIYFPPDYAEKVMEGSRKMLRKLGNKCELMIVDSISAFVPEKVATKEVGEATVAISAKLLHDWFDKLRIDNEYAAVLAINQHTSKIGYGNPVTKGGGYAMKYDPHLSLEIKGEPTYTGESDTEGAIGLDMSIRVVKNKIGPPGRVAKVKFLREFGGFDILDELITLAVDQKVIESSPPWYYVGEKKFQGRTKFADYLRENKKMLKKLIKRVCDVSPEELGVV